MKKMSKFYVCLLTMIAFPIGLASCGTTTEKLDYDMSNVKFEDKTVTYDGNEHTLEITGTLPEGVSVSYTNNKLTEIGSIEATATFVGDYEHYNVIPDMTATLTIAPPQDSEGNYIINGIKYKDNGETMSVVGYTTYGINRDASIMREVLGKPVTSIGDSAFEHCTSLTSITIPDSVTDIGDRAFYQCFSLTSITIPDSVTTIGDWAFTYCISLASITIPDSVTTISDSAFFQCSSLTSITIPDSVTSIGGYAFFQCSSLTSITIPDSVTTIGDWAFDGCSSLTSIVIGNGVTSINFHAFSYCTSLTSITIPDSVTSIVNYAFYECSSLTDIYYSGTEEQWNNISIGSRNDYLVNATIHFNHEI